MPYRRTGSDPVCTFTGYLLGTKRPIAVASRHCAVATWRLARRHAWATPLWNIRWWVDAPCAVQGV